MSDSALLLVGLSAVFSAVAVAVVAMVRIPAAPLSGVARSLAVIDRMSGPRTVGPSPLPKSGESFGDGVVSPAMELLAGLAHRMSPRRTAARVERHLELAGNPSKWTVERIFGAKGFGLIAGTLLALLFFSDSALFALLAGTFVFATAGFLLPDVLLYNQASKRQQKMRMSIADGLDLLTLGVEAGLGFDAALAQVARNTEGPIAAEFYRILKEMQIGKSRTESIAGLGERTSVAELRGVVTALVQADRLGVPIAQVLREQAKEMRLKRRQLAEEKAHKVPVMILFPLMLCVLPALFVIIMGPGIIQMIGMFGNM